MRFKGIVSIAALAAAAGPALAQGQTVVTTRVPAMARRAQDTVRILRLPASVEQLRMISGVMTELGVVNKQLEDQMLAEMRSPSFSFERAEALQERMDRNFTEILAKHDQLALGCLTLLAKDEMAGGTLGLDIRDSVVWERDPVGGTLTILFDGAPKIGFVHPGSPADKAGLRGGDVWVSVNGKPLAGEVRLDELLKPGTPVVSRVQRDGKEWEVSMMVAKKPSEYPADVCNETRRGFPTIDALFPRVEHRISGGPPSVKKPQVRTSAPAVPGPGGGFQVFVVQSSIARWSGASLTPLDDETREFSGLQGDGLLVTDLVPGSPSETSGFRKFDLIRQVNGAPVATVGAFQRIVDQQRAVVFTVFRKSTNSTFSITWVR